MRAEAVGSQPQRGGSACFRAGGGRRHYLDQWRQSKNPARAEVEISTVGSIGLDGVLCPERSGTCAVERSGASRHLRE